MASVHKLCTLAIQLCTHALTEFSPVYTLQNSLRPVYTIDQGLLYTLANFIELCTLAIILCTLAIIFCQKYVIVYTDH